jgi:hypothetical protein
MIDKKEKVVWCEKDKRLARRIPKRASIYTEATLLGRATSESRK